MIMKCFGMLCVTLIVSLIRLFGTQIRQSKVFAHMLISNLKSAANSTISDRKTKFKQPFCFKNIKLGVSSKFGLKTTGIKNHKNIILDF